MANEVKLPRLGQGMESGSIVKWLKSEGEQVKKREPLYELDTDKVTQEVEADVGGVLLKILVSEGEVPVGETIAWIGEAGEDVPESAGGADAGAVETPAAEEPPATSAEKPAEAPAREPERAEGRDAAAAAAQAEPAPTAAPADGRVKASPLARRIARERGIDLAQVRGTGPDGRIVAADLEGAEAPAAAPQRGAAAPARTGEVEVVPLTSVRKTIARRLTEAWQAPVFQLGISVDMTRALELRERLVAGLQEGQTKPTVNDVLTKLVAAALVRHPEVNAHYKDDAIHRFPYAHVGIAVAAPSGLIVPVVRDADRLTILEVAASRADLVGRARAGKLTLPDLEDGTFSISNLGMFGIDEFIAVLNPPQAAILAVGATTEQPVVVDGDLDVRPMCRLTLTCDHRAIDGADGAEFLRTLKSIVEEPALAL